MAVRESLVCSKLVSSVGSEIIVPGVPIKFVLWRLSCTLEAEGVEGGILEDRKITTNAE